MGKKKQRNSSKPNKKGGQKNRKNKNQVWTSKRGKGRTKTISGWEKYFNSFNEWLKPKGIFMRDVDGDGNCLFRSISDQIEGQENNHRRYRDMALKHMKDNRDFFKFFLDEKEDFDKYLKDMSENGTWGGHFELVALSAALGVNFILHMKDKDPYLITAGAKYKKTIKTYHLAYHIDEHYSSVRKIGDVGFTPAEDIVLDFKFVVENDEVSTDEEEDETAMIDQIIMELEQQEASEEDSIFESLGIPSFDTVYEQKWLSGWDGKIELNGLIDFKKEVDPLIKITTVTDSTDDVTNSISTSQMVDSNGTITTMKIDSTSKIIDSTEKVVDGDCKTKSTSSNTQGPGGNTSGANSNTGNGSSTSNINTASNGITAIDSGNHTAGTSDNGMNSNGNDGANSNSTSGKTKKGWTQNKKKKVGPNDPCPCKSGMKLKKCCKVA